MPCAHLAPPQPAALEVLRDPTRWRCLACGSTDGVWCCLTCGHVGCGRNARHPELGGGHALSHHHVCSTHTVVLDVLSGAAYCYMCERDDPLSQGWVLEDPPWLFYDTWEAAAAGMLRLDAARDELCARQRRVLLWWRQAVAVWRGLIANALS